MHILDLPEELLHSIITCLSRQDLLNFNLVNRHCYASATPLIWREVELRDCRSTRRRPRLQAQQSGVRKRRFSDDEGDGEGREEAEAREREDGEGGDLLEDEHDDSPLIAKLLVILANKRIATSVHILTHRCHLPPPPIFEFLPRFPFAAQTLSTDPRTIKLVQLAAREMTQVHTLRIILGHPSLTDALLRCFFDVRRASVPEIIPVRRVWLENCRISAGLNSDIASHPYGLPLKLNFLGLQSVRIRRLPMHCGVPFQQHLTYDEVVYSRDGTHRQLPDNAGSSYTTLVSYTIAEAGPEAEHVKLLEQQNAGVAIGLPSGAADSHVSRSPLQRFYARTHELDDLIWESFEKTWGVPALVQAAKIPRKQRALVAYRGSWLDPQDLLKTDLASPAWKRLQRERIPSASAAIQMFRLSSTTLTSINLDWVLTNERPFNQPIVSAARALFYRNFFSLHFPSLRSLQFRNAVTSDTILPKGMYLFDRWNLHISGMYPTEELSPPLRAELEGYLGLQFLERHTKLQCLAWPVNQFFAPNRDEATRGRVEAVVANLARTLTELRVDAMYAYGGDPKSVRNDPRGQDDLLSRARFMTTFVHHLRNISTIKLEGGIPRDERREILIALRNCSHHLRKIVLIGSSHPLGNTWGAGGEAVNRDIGIAGNFFDADDEFLRMGLEGEEYEVWRRYSALDSLPTGSSTSTSSSSDLPHPPPSSFLSSATSPPAPPPASTSTSPSTPSASATAQWTPTYGHSSQQPPLLFTLALHFSSSIRELKFCGYRGSPILLDPTGYATYAFSALKFFHGLEKLTTAFWLSTFFEEQSRDEEVIGFWRDRRDRNSTALVFVPSSIPPLGGIDEEGEGENPWSHALRTKFSPEALANHVLKFLGPLLSPVAKAKPGGVLVRASFSLGAGGLVCAIWDLDLRIASLPSPSSEGRDGGGRGGGGGHPGGKGGGGGRDVVLEGSIVGPRTEGEDEERRREKEDSRGWF